MEFYVDWIVYSLFKRLFIVVSFFILLVYVKVGLSLLFRSIIDFIVYELSYLTAFVKFWLDN